jgi:hypothetical protein
MTSTIAHALVHIDGSFCEGGGQLLRNAVALSALLSKPISIANVRSNRKPPGLRKQHEAGTSLRVSVIPSLAHSLKFLEESTLQPPSVLLKQKGCTSDPPALPSSHERSNYLEHYLLTLVQRPRRPCFSKSPCRVYYSLPLSLALRLPN